MSVSERAQPQLMVIAAMLRRQASVTWMCRFSRRLLLATSVLLAMVMGPSSRAAAQSCTNLACYQVSCLGSSTTSISGTVYAPNGTDPIPNVIVYVPNGTVLPFVDGPANDTESSLVTGSPLVNTTSAADGTFTLTNVPAGTAFPLVLQAGRWRRQLTVPSVNSCVNTPVSNFNPASDVFARFPQTQTEGDIPKMALVTAHSDALECSLRKMGIADTEFTDYTVNASALSSPGRISLFEGVGSSGAKAGSTVHTEANLMGNSSSSFSGSLLGNYNIILLPCQGTSNDYTTLDGRTNAITFAGTGGRIFATHHSAFYLDQDASIDGAANWSADHSISVSGSSANSTLNMNFSSGSMLAQWLQDLGSTTTVGQVYMSSLFSDQTSVNSPTESWVTFNSAANGVAVPVLQFSFYTPVGAAAANQYGRVMFSEYHVDNATTSSSVTFPAECTGTMVKTVAMTAQEHILEYSLFDLMNFALPVVAPTVSIGITNSPSTFTGGDAGDSVTVTVQNTGASAIPTTPTVYLTVSLPAGLTPIAMTDSGGLWNCNVSSLTCTLTSAWGSGASDAITITVGVAANVSVGSPSVSATVASAGFSSNVTSPITLTVSAAPAGTVTAGGSSSASTTQMQTTGSATSTFAISAGTTIGTISVVTQGATGLDFTNAGTGTCTTTTYGSSASCTVNVSFNPQHPGPRYGAVKLSDGSGNLLATQYISDIGVAPQMIFSPGVQSALGGGLSQPYGVATDSSGNVFVADQGHNAVKEIPSGCTISSCVVTIGGGFSSPYAVAMDGAGNVLVADNGNNAVKEIPSGCTTSSCVVAVGGGIGSPAGIAVDGSGNVFVTDSSDGFVIEIPVGCNASSCTTTLGGGFGTVNGIAVDGNGNVFVADTSNAEVKEFASSCLTASCVSTLGGGFSQPYSLAVDASGNLFVGDQGNSAIKEIPNGCTSSSCVSTLSGIFSHAFGLALDGSGNLFVGDTSATTVAKLDFADPPSLTFASTPVSSSSSAQSVIVSNDGNAALNFTSSGVFAPTDFIKVAGSGSPSDCANSGAVAASASCNLSIEFSPLSTGSLTESFVLTDNNLNVAAATQSLSLSGTAQAVTITVSPSSGTLSGGTVGASYSQTFTASGGTGPYTYAVTSGTLPVGLTLSASGVLSGTPTATANSSFTITATDSTGAGSGGPFSGQRAYSLAISSPQTIIVSPASATLTAGSVGASYSQTFTASGGTGPYTYTVSSGTLPAGLTLSSTGVLSGTLTAVTNSSFTITATDGDSATGSRTYSFTINQGVPVITWAAPATIIYGTPLSVTQLHATSGGVAGTFVYSPSAGTVLATGPHTLSVTFTPTDTTDYSSPVLGSVAVTVGKATSTVVVASSSNPALMKSELTFTATVDSATGTPTGTVNFLDGNTTLGSGTLSSGVATLTNSSLASGTHPVTAVYVGDANISSATSNSLSQIMMDFGLSSTGAGGSGSSGTGSSQTASPGGAATYGVVITPISGTVFPTPATLTVSGLPAGAVASISPSTWTQVTSTSWSLPANVALNNVSLTVQLPAATASLERRSTPRRRFPPLILALLVLPFTGKIRRGTKHWGATMFVLFGLAIGTAAVLGMSGCGSHNGFFGKSGQQSQTYTVTVTVTTGALTHSTNLTLTVK